MKPERKINPDTLYWTCANPDHRHKTEEVARRCLSLHSKAPMPTRRWTVPMYEEVIDLRSKGMTWREIGESFGGLSPTRISQVYRKGLRMLAEQKFFDNNPGATTEEWWTHWKNCR